MFLGVVLMMMVLFSFDIKDNIGILLCLDMFVGNVLFEVVINNNLINLIGGLGVCLFDVIVIC